MKLKHCIPFIFIFILLGILYRELFYSNKEILPSALIGESLPAFSLTDLNKPQEKFTEKNLQGQVALLNVWATWCYACSIEHPMLMKIRDMYHIPIYSIDYKDNPHVAQKWLREHGNPYQKVGSDINGDLAIDLGVYGTPETFVISPAGEIVYRQVGAINQQTWDTVLYPIIKKYMQ